MRITAGLLSVTREGTLDYANVLIDASGMSLDSGGVASGTTLTFTGASGVALLALNGGSVMDHQDSLVMTPADTFPIVLTGRSCLIVEVDLTSSGFNAPGRSGVSHPRCQTKNRASPRKANNPDVCLKVAATPKQRPQIARRAADGRGCAA